MIDSLLKNLAPLSSDESQVREKNQELSSPADSEDSLVNSLPIVQRIVRRKAILDVSEMVQKIALRLIKWKNKYHDKSREMSLDEWKSFAAQTAYNEVNRHYSKPTNANVSLDLALEVSSSKLIEGNSTAEIYSLVRLVWQEICCLSLRQKRALLLSSQELIIYFLKCEITDENLAEILNLTMEDWIKTKEKLPLSDMEIAGLILETTSQKSLESIAKSVKKARHEARLKLRRLIER